MRVFFLSVLVLFSHSFVSAHGGEEQSEQHQILTMIYNEIVESLEQARRLSNTLLSEEVDVELKCSKLNELRLLMINTTMAIHDFERYSASYRPENAVLGMSNEAELHRLMFIHNAQEQIRYYQVSEGVFSGNLKCATQSL